MRSRSIAIEVIRNIMISGKRPIMGAPMRSNVCGWLSKMYLKRMSRAGATRKTIASVRRSRRSWPSTRAVVASVRCCSRCLREGDEGVLELVAVGALEQLGGAAGGDDPP